MKRIHKKILAIFTAILLAVTTFVLAGEKTFSAWAVDDLETVDETTSQIFISETWKFRWIS